MELVAELSINAGVGVSLGTTVEPYWMDSIIDFLAKDRVPANEKEVEKYVGQLLDIGCSPIVSYIEDLLTGLTYSACTPARLRNS